MTTTVAALFVTTDGVYFGLDHVDPWDEHRDARLYADRHPVVCHPPCQRWSKLAYVQQARNGHRVGDDHGCFASALQSVRLWGVVLEHPEASAAWPAHGLTSPRRKDGWIRADDRGGWTCCVYQRHYGHRAGKPTWLYANGVELPRLPIGPGEPAECRVEWMAGLAKERNATPIAFRDLLISMAQTARK